MEAKLIIKRLFFGILWFIVLYMGACIITGGVAGAIAGIRSPDNASAAGSIAGREAVLALRVYFLFGSAALALVGTWFGVLPGTRKVAARPPT